MLEVIRFRKKRYANNKPQKFMTSDSNMMWLLPKTTFIHIFEASFVLLHETQFTLSDKTQTFWKKTPNLSKNSNLPKVNCGYCSYMKGGEKKRLHKKFLNEKLRHSRKISQQKLLSSFFVWVLYCTLT